MTRSRLLPLSLCWAFIACNDSFYEHDAANYVAPYDPACDSLDARPLDIETVLSTREAWEKPIPRKIHQIWLGPAGKFDADYTDKVDSWRHYAETLGYEHHLWRADDVHVLKNEMAVGNADLFGDLLHRRAYHAAADVLRYEIVANFGGMYVDCDIKPPTYNGEFVDFSQIVAMYGLVLAPEPRSRNIGSGDALFAMNGWFMASPDHPLMRHLTRSVRENFQKWDQEQDRLVAAYATGPFLLNRTLAGSFTMVPMSFLKQLDMVDFW